jgi:hypothetical protein
MLIEIVGEAADCASRLGQFGECLLQIAVRRGGACARHAFDGFGRRIDFARGLAQAVNGLARALDRRRDLGPRVA